MVVKEEPKEEAGMNDTDIVMTNTEMVLDDILGDDIIGECSGNYFSWLICELLFSLIGRSTC